jgi:Spy/CpxP family protein refolding chaperone
MARQIVWAIALVALIPSLGRASELGTTCDREQASQQRGAHPPQAAGKPDKDKADDHPQPRPKWWIDQKLRTELGITDQQSAAVDKIWQASMPSLMDGHQKLDKLEEALSQMADATDEAAVKAQIDKVENFRAELSKQRTLMIYRMNRLLTPDQRAKVKLMYERREPPKRDGRNSSRR